MKIRLEQKEQTRRRLIDAALQLAADHGFSSLSLRDVAKAADITPAGFYRHFRDLDELGLVMVDEIALALRQLIRKSQLERILRHEHNTQRRKKLEQWLLAA